jgi:hypothetical protein
MWVVAATEGCITQEALVLAVVAVVAGIRASIAQ